MEPTAKSKKTRHDQPTDGYCAHKDKKNKNGICILHFSESKDKAFTFISETRNPEEQFTKIMTVRSLRLSQPEESHYRMASICNQIPSKVGAEHGYHRDC